MESRAALWVPIANADPVAGIEPELEIVAPLEEPMFIPDDIVDVDIGEVGVVCVFVLSWVFVSVRVLAFV